MMNQHGVTRRAALLGAVGSVVASGTTGAAESRQQNRVVILVSGGAVQEVFTDGAEVYIMDFDGDGSEDWNIGSFPTTPLSALPSATSKEMGHNPAVAKVIRTVIGE